MRMAVLAGFGWTIGFILFLLPDGHEGFKLYLVTIFKYLFILLNATPGLFIFVVYVCNRRVFALYRRLLTKIYQFFQRNFIRFKEFISNHSRNCLNRTKNKIGKFNQIQKQDIIPMNTLILTKVIKPVQPSNQTTLAQLLSEQHEQSSQTKST